MITVNNEKFDIEKDTLIMDALKQCGVLLDLPCGGNGKCGKCKVKAHGKLSEITEDEIKQLTKSEIESGIRLACRTKIEGDAEITTLDKKETFKVLNDVSHIKITDNSLFEKYGISFDIGTTTLALQLYDKDGIIADAARKNPQISFGADVILRIGESIGGKGAELQKLILSAISEMAKEACEKAGIATTDIDAAVITGNTVMLYLLTDTNPTCLSKVPFEADRLFGEYWKCEELPFADNAKIYLPKCIAAFVGADITNAIQSSGMLNKNETSIMVDIGTNGEMVIWHKGKIACCSTAAGPAFEGAEIEFGMSGVPGAIDKVRFEKGKIVYTTIGQKKAVGICGSGIIDAVNVMAQQEFIDENGAFDEDNLKKAGLFYRYNGGVSCEIAENIYLTQRDIRNVQLAKSSIHAGLLTMMHIIGVDEKDVDVLYIAGGFGSFMNIESAVGIGIIPSGLKEKTKIIGNAAIKGATFMLADKKCIDEFYLKLKDVNVIDLSTSSVFMDNYVDGMCF